LLLLRLLLLRLLLSRLLLSRLLHRLLLPRLLLPRLPSSPLKLWLPPLLRLFLLPLRLPSHRWLSAVLTQPLPRQLG
jgi:hypothetical protein